MTEPWQTRERLPASWRGIPFEVDADAASFGQRLHVHTFPQRDRPWTEPLGRAPDEFEVTAYVIGADYDRRRDALITAARKGGAGWLEHPHYGRLRVHLRSARVTHRIDQQRSAALSLTFVEAGDGTFPIATSSPATAADEAAEALVATSSRAANAASAPVAAQPAWYEAELERFTAEESRRLAGAIGLELDPDADIRDAISSIEDIYQLLSLAVAETLTAFVDLGTLASELLRAAQEAWGADVRRQAIARAASIALATEWDSREQAIGVAAEITAAIDAELDRSTDQTAVEALLDLRASYRAAVEDAAFTLAGERDVTVAQPMPATALAFDLYGDPLRDAELARRNGVVHPGFVAGQIRALER